MSPLRCSVSELQKQHNSSDSFVSLILTSPTSTHSLSLVIIINIDSAPVLLPQCLFPSQSRVASPSESPRV